MYKLIKNENKARRGEFSTVHGTVQTPAFMNVGTSAAIKGGISSYDLADLKCQVELCNTYHLHLRPGDKTIHSLGGLHKFMGWQKPILTDSGGFQVFSLSKLRVIKEQGVFFQSHIVLSFTNFTPPANRGVVILLVVSLITIKFIVTL